MHGVCKKQAWVILKKVLCFLMLSLLFIPISLAADPGKSQIKISEPQEETEATLNEKINKESANPQIIEIFNSTLFDKTFFDTSSKRKRSRPSPSLMWLHDPEIQEKRSQVIGSESNIFESWWKINLGGFSLEDDLDFTQVIRTKINTKVITQFMDSFFAKAEFELFTSSGSIQKIYQRIGETNGISQREILLLWRATNWLTIQVGAINQGFLQSPLLLGEIPFPSLIKNIELFKGEQHNLSLTLQGAIPTTFSDKHSLRVQELAKTPLLLTSSFFWHYDPNSYYKVTLNSTLFHYSPLPSDIALASKFYGNTVVHQPSVFKYRYSGFYIGLEPSFQIFPNVGVKLKAHYIHNTRDTAPNHNRGELYSIQIPFDITENIRITPVFEYFRNQSDSAVAYYNSERYGHSSRTGFVGEVILNLYNRNLEVGFRHLRSSAVREQGSLKTDQIYYLLFLRTNYAKI